MATVLGTLCYGYHGYFYGTLCYTCHGYFYRKIVLWLPWLLLWENCVVVVMATVLGTLCYVCHCYCFGNIVLWLPWLLLWEHCVIVAMATVMGTLCYACQGYLMGKLCYGLHGYCYGDILLAFMDIVIGMLSCGSHDYLTQATFCAGADWGRDLLLCLHWVRHYRHDGRGGKQP
jgi:hypothetical protein